MPWWAWCVTILSACVVECIIYDAIQNHAIGLLACIPATWVIGFIGQSVFGEF